MKENKNTLLLRFERGVGWYLKSSFKMSSTLPQLFASRDAAIKWCKKNGYRFID